MEEKQTELGFYRVMLAQIDVDTAIVLAVVAKFSKAAEFHRTPEAGRDFHLGHPQRLCGRDCTLS